VCLIGLTPTVQASGPVCGIMHTLNGGDTDSISVEGPNDVASAYCGKLLSFAPDSTFLDFVHGQGNMPPSEQMCWYQYPGGAVARVWYWMGAAPDAADPAARASYNWAKADCAAAEGDDYPTTYEPYTT
jgi:hypothetical protein